MINQASRRSGLVQALVAAGLLALLAAAIPAQAHGATPTREIDTRILQDDDGLLGYGGCVEEACQPLAPADGLDLLALDMREAYLAGQPALVLRISYQTEAATLEGHSIVVRLSKGGQPITLQADGNADGSFRGSFLRIDGPVPIGDGHPQAIDGWIGLTAFGLQTGDVLDGITVESALAGEPDDRMPGGWFSQGLEVPRVPTEPDPAGLAGTAAGTYTLAGPATLLDATASATSVDLSTGPATLKVRVTNPLATLPQFVNAALVTTDGLSAGLDAVALNLDAGAARDLTLTVPATSSGGNATLLLTSDLGGQRVLDFTIAAPPAATNTTTSATATGTDHAQRSPGLAAPSLAVLAVVVAALRRGRTRRQPL